MHARMRYPGLAVCLEFLWDTCLPDLMARALHLCQLEDFDSARQIYEQVKSWLLEADEIERHKDNQYLYTQSLQHENSKEREPHEWIREYSSEDRHELIGVMEDNLLYLNELETGMIYNLSKEKRRIGYRCADGNVIVFGQLPKKLKSGESRSHHNDSLDSPHLDDSQVMTINSVESERYHYEEAMRARVSRPLWVKFKKMVDSHCEEKQAATGDRVQPAVTAEVKWETIIGKARNLNQSNDRQPDFEDLMTIILIF